MVLIEDLAKHCFKDANALYPSVESGKIPFCVPAKILRVKIQLNVSVEDHPWYVWNFSSKLWRMKNEVWVPSNKLRLFK